MTWDGIVSGFIVAGVAWLLIVPPIFKPWYGLRRPKGCTGKWWE